MVWLAFSASHLPDLIVARVMDLRRARFFSDRAAPSLSDLTKGQVRLDPRDIGVVDPSAFGQLPFPFRVFRRHQMAARRLRAQNFSRAGDFESLGNGLLRF